MAEHEFDALEPPSWQLGSVINVRAIEDSDHGPLLAFWVVQRDGTMAAAALPRMHAVQLLTTIHTWLTETAPPLPEPADILPPGRDEWRAMLTPVPGVQENCPGCVTSPRRHTPGGIHLPDGVAPQ